MPCASQTAMTMTLPKTKTAAPTDSAIATVQSSHATALGRICTLLQHANSALQHLHTLAKPIEPEIAEKKKNWTSLRLRSVSTRTVVPLVAPRANTARSCNKGCLQLPTRPLIQSCSRVQACSCRQDDRQEHESNRLSREQQIITRTTDYQVMSTSAAKTG
jgi:hypothetical protein